MLHRYLYQEYLYRKNYQEIFSSEIEPLDYQPRLETPKLYLLTKILAVVGFLGTLSWVILYLV